MLIEADRQQHEGIALALSFAAIEALVCTKTEGIVDELSRNVATLLLHKPKARPKAVSELKKLYTLRSKILHGENIAVPADEAKRTRVIAGQVFLAVSEWRDFVRRMGDDSHNLGDFADEMKNAQLTGDRMPGIPAITSTFFQPSIFE